MITEHLTDLELDLYRQRGMAAERLIAANAHLLTCEACYGRFGAEAKEADALAILRDLQALENSEIEHLSFEQLAAYVDDKAGEKLGAEIRQHVQECGECETRLAELIALKPLVMPSPTPKRETQQSLGERFAAFWKPLSIGPALQVTSLLLVAVLLPWAVVLKNRIASLEREVSQLEKANEVLAQNGGNATPPAVRQNDLPGAEQGTTTPTSEETSVIIAVLRDGSGQISLDNKGNVSGLRALSQAYESSIREALNGARLQIPDMPSGADKADVFMGGTSEENFALLSPVGKVIQTRRPTFRWQALKGATRYTVRLKDSTGRVMESGDLTEPLWTPDVPLGRGMIYTWQIAALKNGKEIVSPAPTHSAAQVKILERMKVDELARARGSQPNAHLLLGILYAKAGLLDEAAREFTILLQNNPGSDIAQKLLNRVKANRR
jgi:hypothetical protein